MDREIVSTVTFGVVAIAFLLVCLKGCEYEHLRSMERIKNKTEVQECKK